MWMSEKYEWFLTFSIVTNVTVKMTPAIYLSRLFPVKIKS